MIKFTKIGNSMKKVECKKSDIEVYEFSSEELGYSSKIQQSGIKLYTELENILSYKFKDYPYECLISVDDTIDKAVIKKIIILLKDEEQIKCVKNTLTGYNIEIEYGILKNIEPEACLSTPSNKSKLSEWVLQLYKYLQDNFKFKGTVRAKVALCHDKVEEFAFTISGKGVNDQLVEVTRNIAEIIKTSNFYNVSLDKMYTFISNFFENTFISNFFES